MTSINHCLMLLIIAYTSAAPQESPCSPDPCENGGNCIVTDTSESGYVCECPEGTYGPTCTSCIVDPNTGLCEDYGFCYLYLDTHYITFDGSTFDYQGICKYLVSKPKKSNNGLPYFEVYARGEYRGVGSSVAWLRYVEIVYGADTIRLSEVPGGPVPGSFVVTSTVFPSTISTTFSSVSYSIYMLGSSNFIRFKTWFGLIVDYDGDSIVRVYVPPTYYGDQLTGICGNFDGSWANDPLECNGYSYSGIPVDLFGDVCVVPDSDKDGCDCSYPTCKPTNPTSKYAERSSCLTDPPTEFVDRCRQLINDDGPFAKCIRTLQETTDITTQKLYDDCIMDACASEGKALCDNVAFLVDLCANLGFKINTDEWQKATKCSTQKV